MLFFSKIHFFTSFFCFLAFWIFEPYVVPHLFGKIINLLKENGSNALLLHYFLIFLSGYMISNILHYIGGMVFAKYLPMIGRYTKQSMFENLQLKSFDFFLYNNEAHLSKSIDIISYNLTQCIDFLVKKFLPCFIVFLAILFKFVANHIYLGMFLVCWTFLHFAVSFYFFPIIQRLSDEENQNYNETNSFFIESFKNQKIKEFFNLHHRDSKNLMQLQEAFVRNQYNQGKSIYLAKFIKGLLCALFQGFLVNFILFKIWKAGAINTGELISLINVNGGLVHLVWHISERFPDFLYNAMRCKAVLKFLDNSDQQFRKKQKLKIIDKEGKINIDNITFSYGDRDILKNFSLIIQPRQKILILGYSGIGKSTLIDIITGLIQNYEGNVFFDGINIKSIKREFFEEYISFITNYGLIPGTVKENITFGNEASDEEVIKVMKKAELYDIDPNEIIQSSHNVRFSDGEKQRILIARGLWQENVKVVICDEPFKGLDFKTKNEISRTILHHVSNKTLIIIDHSLCVAKDVDLILFFSGNHIVSGTFEELSKNNKEFASFIKDSL